MLAHPFHRAGARVSVGEERSRRRTRPSATQSGGRSVSSSQRTIESHRVMAKCRTRHVHQRNAKCETPGSRQAHAQQYGARGSRPTRNGERRRLKAHVPADDAVLGGGRSTRSRRNIRLGRIAAADAGGSLETGTGDVPPGPQIGAEPCAGARPARGDFPAAGFPAANAKTPACSGGGFWLGGA